MNPIERVRMSRQPGGGGMRTRCSVFPFFQFPEFMKNNLSVFPRMVHQMGHLTDSVVYHGGPLWESVCSKIIYFISAGPLRTRGRFGVSQSPYKSWDKIM